MVSGHDKHDSLEMPQYKMMNKVDVNNTVTKQHGIPSNESHRGTEVNPNWIILCILRSLVKYL